MTEDVKEKALAHWELIDRLARRRFGDRPLAEEAALAVLDRLRENDWRRLHEYRRASSFTSFLTVVVWRLLEDFARKRYGRRRPPAWIRNLGGIWSRLYDLLCLQRLEIAAAVAAVQQHRPRAEANRIEDAAWVVRQRVIDCGSHQGLEVAYEDREATADPVFRGEESEDRGLEEKQRRELFRALFEVLTEVPEKTVERNLEALCRLRISLKPEEKLLLQLCYQDGLSVSHAGKMLGYNRYQAHGRLRRLLARLRGEFERVGLDRELLILLRE